MIGGTDYHVLKSGSFEGSCPGGCDCEGPSAQEHPGEAHSWACNWDEFESNVGIDDVKDALAELLAGGGDWPHYTIPDELRAKAEKFCEAG